MSTAASTSASGLDFSTGKAPSQNYSGAPRPISAATIDDKARAPPTPCTTPPAWRCALLFTVAALSHWGCPFERPESAHNASTMNDSHTPLATNSDSRRLKPAHLCTAPISPPTLIKKQQHIIHLKPWLHSRTPER